MVETKLKIGVAIFLMAALLAVGTVAFPHLEKYPGDYWEAEKRGQPWTYIDSFYFSAVTLTTIGYGDIYPTNDASKLFTVFYAVFGVALVLYVLGVIARWYVERSQQFEQHEIAKLRQLLYGNPRKRKPKEEQ